MSGRNGRWLGAAALVGIALLIASSGAPASQFINWSGYLNGPSHLSYQPGDTAITPANAGALKVAWHFTPPVVPRRPTPKLWSSPIVYNGVVYQGSNSGTVYALNETTGAIIWSRNFSNKGLDDTPTVAIDPVSGLAVLYINITPGHHAKGGVFLDAVDAARGTVLWSTLVDFQDNDFAWASPTVANGAVYVGVAAATDSPIVRGSLARLDQHTGAITAQYFTMPTGTIGGGIWSSPLINGNSVYVTTGNPLLRPTDPQGDSFSIVKLDATTLVKTGIYTVPNLSPNDSDFGASPVIFGTSPPLIGACNKNGRFYALDPTTMTPVWTALVGSPEVIHQAPDLCLAAAIWDGTRLFVGSNLTTINSVAAGGSVRQVDPATGAFIWEAPMPRAVVGSPSLNGSGVIAAPTANFTAASGNGVFLLDASNGTQLAALNIANSPVFAQPTFADGYLFVASVSDGLIAFHP